MGPFGRGGDGGKRFVMREQMRSIGDDFFGIEIAAGTDEPLLLAITVAIDELGRWIDGAERTTARSRGPSRPAEVSPRVL